MSDRLEILEHNLVLIPGQVTENGPLTISSTDLLPLVPNGILAEGGGRVINPSTQISLLASPPSLVVIDHSSEPPVRGAVVQLVTNVVGLLDQRGYTVTSYGWNFTGLVSGITTVEALRQLVNESLIEAAMTTNGAREWSIPVIQVSGESHSADELSLTLQLQDGDEQPDLRFTANVHFERRLSLAELAESGNSAWAEVDTLVTGLTR